MTYSIHAHMLDQFVDMDDKNLLEQLGTAVRNWEGFAYIDDLRVAYDRLNNGQGGYARHIINGVIGELSAEHEWTAEEILKREG